MIRVKKIAQATLIISCAKLESIGIMLFPIPCKVDLTIYKM